MKRKMKQSRVLADLIAKTPEEPAEEINLPVKFYPFYVDVSKYEFTDKEKELIEKHKDLIDELETGFRNVKNCEKEQAIIEKKQAITEYDKTLMKGLELEKKRELKEYETALTKLIKAGLIWYPPVAEAIKFKWQIGDRTFLRRAKLGIEKGALRLMRVEEYLLEGMIEDYFDECIASGKKPNLKTLHRRLQKKGLYQGNYVSFFEWLKRHDLP